MIVDRYNFQPVYYQLAEQLKSAIIKGKLKADSQMQTELEMIQEYNVSRNTVRSALKKLENEGLIYRVKGKGTFVSPKSSKTLTLLVVLNVFPHGHSSIQGLISGTLVRAQEAGSQLQLITQEQLPSTLESIRNNPSIQAGVIFLRARNVEPIALLTDKLGIPLIIEGKSIPKFNYIDIDNTSAMNAIVDHLYGLGHRHFGMIQGIEPGGSHHLERYDAVLKRLKGLGIDYDPAYTIPVDVRGSKEKRFETISSQFMSFPKQPTAMICFTDTLAAEFIRWCHHNSIDVPGQVSVTGFDNSDTCRYLEPLLTTIDQNYYDIGYQTAGHMLDMMKNFINRKLQLKLKLEPIFRESTGPVSVILT